MKDAVLPFLLPFLAAIGLVRLALTVLRRRAILDLPNERSSHTVPTPRGGGWGVVPVVLAAWLVFAAGSPAPAGLTLALCGAIALLLLSWADDLHDLSPRTRLFGQALAVLAGLAALPGDCLIAQGWLPLWADRLVAALAWLWFVNLTNFMDGIDGITGAELAAVGLGLAALGGLGGPAQALSPYALALAGAAAGFLIWNWHPARLFMGDVGSVPLGYLTGWLLIQAAGAGLWLPALILPAYYLADATITLGRRAWRGEKVWQAHRQHFYQQAVQRGRRHHQVVLAITAANAGLVLCALVAPAAGPVMLLPAALLVGGLLVHLSRRPA